MPQTHEHRDPSRQLSANDWAHAALRAIASGGLAAVKVERLAAELGTTKGSFYWHHRNRDALLVAALELWEQEHTEALIAAVEREADPRNRLRRLFLLITEEHPANQIEIALLATGGDPRVQPMLTRVTERRIAYVADLFEQMGWRPAMAQRQALLAYSAWLGFTQLVQVTPSAVPSGRAQQRYITHVLDTLLEK